MAQRGNRPIDPQDIKGGVRGTHGLGDAPRESGTHWVSKPNEPTRDSGVADEATGEEHGFEMSLAIGELESIDDRAERRERDAAIALEEIEEEENAAASAESAATDDEVLGDPRSDEEERRERGLATETTPGPGPKDRDAGRARVQHLEDHGLRTRH